MFCIWSQCNQLLLDLLFLGKPGFHLLKVCFINYIQMFGLGREYYAVLEELRKARVQVACLHEFAMVAENRDEAFSALNFTCVWRSKN